MTQIDLEAEYNNRARVPEYADIAARWAAKSAELRKTLAFEGEISYGGHARQTYDVVHPLGAPGDQAVVGGDGQTPLVVYIHGGYWQRGAPSDYTFVCEQFALRGVRVCVAGYRLCPDVLIGDIVDDIALCLGAIWRRYRQYPLVIGHSAGGHLAAMMLARDWSGDGDVPNDLVRAALSISGVFELGPLVGLTIGEALALDRAQVEALSPRFAPVPSAGQLLAAVGGDESAEFIRQSVDFANAWAGGGMDASSTIVPGKNHFTVVDELARADSDLFVEAVNMLERIC